MWYHKPCQLNKMRAALTVKRTNGQKKNPQRSETENVVPQALSVKQNESSSDSQKDKWSTEESPEE
jgi:hypothetical protein